MRQIDVLQATPSEAFASARRSASPVDPGRCSSGPAGVSTVKRDGFLTFLPWAAPWLAGFVLFTALPVGLGIWYAFTDYTLLEPPIMVGTKNFARLADDPILGTVALEHVLLWVAFDRGRNGAVDCPRGVAVQARSIPSVLALGCLCAVGSAIDCRGGHLQAWL